MSDVVGRVVARDDVTVKMDAQTVRMAKMVAAARGITLAEYLTEVVRPVVDRDLERETRKALDVGARSGAGAKKSRKAAPEAGEK